MSPDKLEKWLARERPRAAKLRILALVVASEPHAVHEWLLQELAAESNRAGAVLDVCADYVDTKGESVQFRLEMLDHDERVITCTHHRASPTDADPRDASTHADLSTNTLIAQFMKHDEKREALLVGSMEAFFKSCANLVGMQGKILEQQQTMIAVLQEQLAQARAAGLVDRELSEEEKQEALQRANAYAKASEIAPVLLQYALENFSRRQAANGNSSEHSSNGKAAA